MLETWLSKERLQSNSTPRFLTDDEESTEQPSSVRQCSRLLHTEVFGLIINTFAFSVFNCKKLLFIQFFLISTMHFVQGSKLTFLLGSTGAPNFKKLGAPQMFYEHPLNIKEQHNRQLSGRVGNILPDD